MVALDENYLARTQIALRVHAEISGEYEDLKDKDLAKYIYLLINRQVSKGLSDCVGIITDIHPNRKEEVENILKKLKFKNNTHIEVFWRDNSPPLMAVYQANKEK